MTTNPNLQLNASGWTFSSTETQKWDWTCLDADGNIAKRCDRRFATLVECIRDATAHGYVPDRTDC